MRRDAKAAGGRVSSTGLLSVAGSACRVMGILNVTTDSFSDGTRYLSVSDAVAHGLALVDDGADIVDIGGESTRPGAERIDAETEARRVIPVVTELAASGVIVSIDTMRSEIASAALEAGATMVNDVSGGLADARMAPTIADAGVPYIAMHWRGHSKRMADLATYDDVVTEVRAELAARVEALLDAGVNVDRIIIDPGLGFAKTADQSWALLRGLGVLADLGLPLLVGASRKSFLGSAALSATGVLPAPTERDQLTSAVSALAAAAGVWGVRVHDVAGTRAAVIAAEAWRRGRA
jgi:dihydropteroate synthase